LTCAFSDSLNIIQTTILWINPRRIFEYMKTLPAVATNNAQKINNKTKTVLQIVLENHETICLSWMDSSVMHQGKKEYDQQ
jgi:hypothetical protein